MMRNELRSAMRDPLHRMWADQERGSQMPKWNYVAMGEVGLTGWRRQAAQPVVRSIARRTGRPEPEILSLIGAGFLLITLIDFLRTVDDVIAAGRIGPQPAKRPGRGHPSPAGTE